MAKLIIENMEPRLRESIELAYEIRIASDQLDNVIRRAGSLGFPTHDASKAFALLEYYRESAIQIIGEQTWQAAQIQSD